MKRVFLRALAAGTLCWAIVSLLFLGQVDSDIVRCLNAPGFIVAWFSPFNDTFGLLLLFAVNWLLWVAAWFWILAALRVVAEVVLPRPVKRDSTSEPPRSELP